MRFCFYDQKFFIDFPVFFSFLLDGVNLQRWASVGIVEFMLVEKSWGSRPSDILLDQKARSVKKNGPLS